MIVNLSKGCSRCFVEDPEAKLYYSEKDLDGDGDADILIISQNRYMTGSEGNASLTIWKNDGDTYSIASEIVFFYPSNHLQRSLAIIDDKDARKSLIINGSAFIYNHKTHSFQIAGKE